MQYKTIVLSLLEQRPVLYDRHRRLRTLLEVLDRYSLELKSRHEGWKDRLRQTRPDSDESQLTAEALEIALKELEERLPTESSTGAAGS
jgi:hypothetical protein